MTDPERTIMDRVIVAFIDRHGRPPSVMELFLLRESVASVQLSHDPEGGSSHVVESGGGHMGAYTAKGDVGGGHERTEKERLEDSAKNANTLANQAWYAGYAAAMQGLPEVSPYEE